MIALGVCLLVAGCTGPRETTPPAPGEDCLLGGPPRAPPPDRTTYNLTDEHLTEHPNLSRVFRNASHLVPVPCQAGLDLFEHLASEGADVAQGPDAYQRNVFLTHDGTTLWVSLHLRR